MNDYCIAINESGPYIAHADGQKKNAKYYARINDGRGGYRYFYSQREYATYINNRNKARAAAEEGKKVSMKQFLTGGKEKKSFKYARGENREAKKELKSTNREYKKSLRNSQKAYAELDDAKKHGNASDIKSAERNVSKARKQIAEASQNAASARINYKQTSEKLKAHQAAYESTSLPGKTHRLVRKGNEKLKQMRVQIGNTPIIYLKKTKD